MRITLPAAFTLLALASPILYAASADPFVGPSIAIGASVGQLSNKVDPTKDIHMKDIPIKGSSIPWSVDTVSGTSSKNSIQPILDFSWNWRIAPTWVAGAGINVETGERKGPESTIVNLKATNSGKTIPGAISSSVKMSQHAEIYGLIGKQLNEDWLLYGKLGYHHAKADSTLQYTLNNTNIPIPNNTQSFNLNGVGIGVGTAYNLKNGLELRAEAEYINFGSYTHQSAFTGKPSMTRVNLMLGYRF